ncbi:MAG: sigma-70 family RNA polymerase sigma factor [Opitutae bacterium]|nr:sigma-70 family RNA polymerase sigma factor [Opitutae bacterium]
MSAPTPPSAEVDPALLGRARAGDEAAFGAIMRAHYERTFRLVYAIVRHEHDARDVCQEVWLTVWRELPNFRGDAQFTTWLHPIATRRSLDHLRKRRRWFDRFLPIAVGDDAVESAPEPAAPDDTRGASERTDRLAQLRRVLDSLPPKLRVVLALREVEGLSYDEIARATSIPTGTVMSRLYHARRLLAQKLKDLP